VTTTPHWPAPPTRVGFGDVVYNADGSINYGASVSGSATVPGGVTDFYSAGKAALGGKVSAIEDQALATMNTWRTDAQGAVLGLLDSDQSKLLSVAIQGAQKLAGGLNPSTFFAVAGLAAAQLAGPVAGAVIGSMLVTLNVMRDAIMGVAEQLHIAAHAVNRSADFLCANGWPKRGQIIPGGPGDQGDGTNQNPGWQFTWNQLNSNLAPCIDCGGVNEMLTGGWDNSCTRGLPPYLNAMPAISSGRQAYVWCELQKVPQDHFLWFFYALWFANQDFAYNCSPIAPVDDRLLLQAAVKTWNASHDSSSTWTYGPDTSTRSDIVPGQTVSNIIGGLILQSPDQQTSIPPVTVNTGPAIDLTPPGATQAAVASVVTADVAASQAAAAANPPMSTTKKVVVGAAAVTGAALVGTAVYAAVTHKTMGAVFGGIGRGIKGAVRR
jgi:hypothetical protein